MNPKIVRAAWSSIEQLESRRLLAHFGPDPDFGNLGDVTIGGSLLVAPVSNGKFIAVNPVKAVRLKANGAVDHSFSDPGAPTPPAHISRQSAAAFIDGSDVMIAGFGFGSGGIGSDSLFARALKLSDGSPDTRFGDGGFATFDAVSVNAKKPVDDVTVDAVEPTPDGGMVFLVTQTVDATKIESSTAQVLYKLDGHGALDNDFGVNGQEIIDSAQSMVVDARSRILILDGSDVLTRYKTNGSVDKSFGHNGHVTLPSSDFSDFIPPMRIQPDGKILFVNGTAPDDSSDFAIYRLNADGSDDTAFNEKFDLFVGEDPINDLLVDHAGNILVTVDDKFLRFTSAGDLDKTFDEDGAAMLPHDSTDAILTDDGGHGYFLANSRHITHLVARDTTVLLPSGVLSVTGTEGDDDIRVTKSGSKLAITVNSVTTKVSTSQVKSIGIQAGGGNNSIDARVAIDLDITTGSGVDAIQTGDGNNSVDSGDGDDSLTTGDGDDDISFNGSVTIVSNGGNDTIHGDDGLGDTDSNKSFGRQNIQIDGGDGDDQISLASSQGSTNPFYDFHHVTINGGAGDDQINPADAQGAIHGGDGNDLIVKAAPHYETNSLDEADSLYGDGGNDTIYGSVADDYISGGGGNDFISGGDGPDSIVGGDGNDTIAGNGGNDTIGGQAGDDVITGSKGHDVLGGGAGNDTLVANDGFADKLFGDSGKDSAQADSLDVLTSIESAST